VDVPRTLIVGIHGVGDPAPGEVVQLMSLGAARISQVPFERRDLVVGGVRYARLQQARPAGLDLVEVNWADLPSRRKTLLGVLQYVFSLLVAMLSVAEAWPGNGKRIFLVRLCKEFIERLALWGLFLSSYVMLLVCATGIGRLLVALAGSVFVTLLARQAESYSPPLGSGVFWGIVFLVLGGVAYALPQSLEALTTISSCLYVLGQAGIGLLLFLAAWGIFLFGGPATAEQKLARLGLLYFPVIGLTTFGALLWAVFLTIAQRNETAFRMWGHWYSRALHYDLRKVEYVTAGGMALIGALALTGAGVYLFDASRWAPEEWRMRSGSLAKAWIAALLWLSPGILSLVGLYFFCSLWQGNPPRGAEEVLEIYRRSSLRIVPYLAFLVGPLSIVTDVVGDVLFYLVPGEGEPGESKLSTRAAVLDRIEALLATLSAADSKYHRIVVLAHSQGSVAAAETLGRSVYRDQGNLELLTVGSPLSALYRRFLGWCPGEPGFPPTRWKNRYRWGDYIGGSIPNVDDRPIGSGGHTNYWQDSEVWNEIQGPPAVAAPPPPSNV
jgi:hypothetical protein